MDLLVLGISAWIAVQIAIGWIVSRRVRTEDDYLVAGRRLGPVLATASVFATWFGSETCVGAAGQIHAEGVTRTTVEPFAYGLCLILTGVVFAAPMWRARITTNADLFRKRFSPRVERLAAVLLVPASLLWAAAQLRAFGEILAAIDACDVATGVAVAALVAVSYTMLGGLLADVVTDIVQGAVLIAGLALLFVTVAADYGGIAATVEAAVAIERPAAGPAPTLLETAEAWALPLCGSVVAQEVVQRSVAARSPGVARIAGIGGGALYLLVGLVPVTLGLLGPELLPGIGDGDEDRFLTLLALDRLSPLAFVGFAGALIAAILSTVDSTLLVSASLLSRNLVLAGRAASDRRRLRVARLAVLGFGGLAWFLASRADSVLGLVEAASGFASAGVLVAITFGLFTGFGGPLAAAASLGAGALVWIGAGWFDAELPYLSSLGAALAGYVVVAAFEAYRARRSAAGGGTLVGSGEIA